MNKKKLMGDSFVSSTYPGSWGLLTFLLLPTPLSPFFLSFPFPSLGPLLPPNHLHNSLYSLLIQLCPWHTQQLPRFTPLAFFADGLTTRAPPVPSGRAAIITPGDCFGTLANGGVHAGAGGAGGVEG